MKLRRFVSLVCILLLLIGSTTVPSSQADLCNWDEATQECKG
jgi:hypothetical protein